MPKLLESDFLTVDLGAVLSMKKPQDSRINVSTEQPGEVTADGATSAKKPSTNINWGKELKQRLSDNSKMSREARKTDYEIESAFFTEFFNANWDEASANQLRQLGEPLKKVFKVLGFSTAVNPIFAFLKLPYVQQELLQTKLLNVNTFKAIYNAVAGKLVADSEFLVANKYNIIYCKDLYKKSPEEMVKYLKLQAQTLPVNAKVYTAAMREKNRRIFVNAMLQEKDIEKLAAILSDSTKKVRLQPISVATLNSLEVAEAIYDAWGADAANTSKSNTAARLGSKAQQALAAKLNTPAKTLATAQLLSMTTNSAEAKKALANKKLSEVSTADLLKATSQVAAIIPKDQLSTADADSLVSILVNNL
jgi:hypothetical protein